ncbi:hypothetical protein OSB04_027851 [Centaurea solstitialis]|uniref:Integrase catalytic domain-containing protein n=1 Tax=Centaurea solstitialis TaxID=347529 RepID=A0AA38SS31_9ASTR|nr:hypothetical protein OSB04_027851 [Centaurea solstitialis]
MLHEDILASLEPKPAPADLMDNDWIDELGDLSCPECGSKDICEHIMNIDQIEIGLPDALGIFMIDCIITSYESWVIDTGSGNHICNHLQGFTRRETLRKDRSNLRVGEGTPLIAEASYSLSLPSGLVLEQENCYYVPKMIKNVLSFDLLVDQGFYYKYDYKMLSVFKNNIFHFKATPVNGLYTVNLQDNNNEIYHISKRSKDIEDQTYLWHCRLGHINKKRVELLLKGGFLGTFDYKPFDNCESCLSGKMTKQPFNKENERATDLLEIIHTDVCGPFSHVARGGYRYFITFTDDFSRYGYVYLMRHKSESFERFREYQNEVQNQLGRKIKFLRSDRGGEYLSDEFDNHLMECGIVSQLTPSYTPQMNGVSERRNRTLLDMVRSMMCRSTLPMSFWGHALETTAHIPNKAPTKSVEKTPYKLWKGKKPKMSFLRIWGCEVYVKRPILEKLKPKSDKCIFVEYPRTTVGYYFYNPEENKVFVARNGKFLEEKFLKIQHENVEPQSESIEEVQTQDLRRSSRVRQEPDRYLGFLITQSNGDLNEPVSYGEAVSGNESEQWQEAMKAEMQSMYDNQVWELEDLPLLGLCARQPPAAGGGGCCLIPAPQLQTVVVAVCSRSPDGDGGGVRAVAVAGDFQPPIDDRQADQWWESAAIQTATTDGGSMVVMWLFVVAGSGGGGGMSKSIVPFYTPEESLRLINGKWKLTGQNFPVWKMHLDNVLDAQYESDVMSILIFSTSPGFSGDLRDKSCHEVVKDIESQLGFYKHTGKLLIMKKILSLKLRKNQSVKDHLIEMRRLFKCLTRLGYKMAQEELMHLMWYSLPKEICDTASAYMKEPRKDVAMLHEDILASLEPKPAPADLMDTDWIDELGDLSCPECGSQDISEHSMNIDQIEIGLPDAPGIFMIDCLITSYESWVIDTGSGNHICNHLQGFSRRETLRKDRSNLRVGEGTPLIAEAVGSYTTPVNGLYTVNLQDNNSETYHISKRSKDIEDQTYLWHCRLGHINKKRIELLLKGDNERASDSLEIVHTDVCGPFSHEARGGYRYFITFTDDFSRYGYVYLMRHKSESFEKFREYHNEVQNQLDRKIKFLRSDRGGEYLSQEFGNHLIECGIVSQLTPPYTPQMNGVSKGGIEHALETAGHILNRAPTKSVEKTPYELWKGKKPKMSFLKIWGCEVYVKRPTSEKLKPKSDKCFFVGYPKTTVGYYFYNPEENKVFVARNGKFLEEKFLSSGNTRKEVDLQVVDEENTTPIVEPEIQHENVEPQSEPIEEVQTQDLRRSNRVRQEPDRYLGFLVSQDSGDLSEPISYGEAVSGSESEQWQEAMKAEMQSMYDNQVWELTDLPQFRIGSSIGNRILLSAAYVCASGSQQPQHCKVVGDKWVFKKKTDMDGNVHTYKARLVAKGFTQTHGIDYDETFSPVAMLKSIRILMAISAYFNYEIWQMDVKTAFLNGKLTEDVYMQQPEGFVDPKNPDKVCKLLKSIYGLKQASRSWNLYFDERIKEFGFAKSEFEPCVYTKFSGSTVTFLVLYVDDILLIGNDCTNFTECNELVEQMFPDERPWRSRLYTWMDESKKGFIPMQHGIVLSKTQCPISSQDQDKMRSVPYASAIGSIMYAMLCTRPDVAYSVSVTSRYQQNPGEPHWVAVKNVLKYLRRTKDMFLVFGGFEDEISVTGYSDASFQTDRDDFRSQSGVVASVSRPIDIFCDNSGAMVGKQRNLESITNQDTPRWSSSQSRGGVSSGVSLASDSENFSLKGKHIKLPRIVSVRFWIGSSIGNRIEFFRCVFVSSVPNSNKVIINSIRKRLKEAKGKWVEELPSVLWANRTTPRTSTGQTPFSLVYGCEAVLPIESQLPIARHRTMEQNVIDLYYDLDALEELREKAFQKMALQKAMVERHFNKKVKAKIFQVGDYVLRQVFQNTQELNAGKLSIKWEGPYRISKVIGNGAYKLTTIEGKEILRSWNAIHLKRYYF